MGRINLLKSSFEGKLGELYGTKQYGNVYLKAIPFSHTPHNEQQKLSFSAFQKLVRFSSGVAKEFSKYLPIETKTMTKTNATTQLLKSAIKKKVFNPFDLSDVIIVDGVTKIDKFIANKDDSTVTIQAHSLQIVDKIHGSAWFVGIFDDTGKIIKYFIPEENEINTTFPIKLAQENSYQAISFASDKVMNKHFLHGLDLSTAMYIINGYLNIDAFPTYQNYSVENGLLKIDDTSVTIADGLLNINV